MDMNRIFVTPEQVKATTPQLFWRYINFNEPDQCWEWQSSTTSAGYGQWEIQVKRTRNVYYAHRLVFMHLFGQLPRKILVCHHCDNPKCCNPNHLFAGTDQDNVDDMIKKGRSSRGSKHGMSKLKEEDILVIKQRLANGEFQRVVAESYGVKQGLISNIANDKRWRHVKT